MHYTQTRAHTHIPLYLYAHHVHTLSVHTFTYRYNIFLGDLYLQNVSKSRQKIAKLGNPFITDGTVNNLKVLKLNLHINGFSQVLCNARGLPLSVAA